MVPLAPTATLRQRTAREPLYDIHPQTGATVEVFYADRTLETFGRCGLGWFWWYRRRGFAPDSPRRGPFPTSYADYRNAVRDANPLSASTPTHTVNPDTARTQPN